MYPLLKCNYFDLDLLSRKNENYICQQAQSTTLAVYFQDMMNTCFVIWHFIVEMLVEYLSVYVHGGLENGNFLHGYET